MNDVLVPSYGLWYQQC